MKRISALFLLLLASVAAVAQSDSMQPYTLAGKWATRVTEARATQPGWASSLAADSLKLNQGIRYDMVRETMPTGKRAWFLGNPSVVGIIPWSRTELDFVPPERVLNHDPAIKDGAGDLTLAAKYRILSANEEGGNYLVSTWLVATLPTGSYSNGSTNGTLQPNAGAGKGWGAFDIQTTVGATLPTGNPAIVANGRPIAWNLIAQYRIARIFVPELENNATFYKGGTTDGKVQNFVTPGLWISKLRIQPHNPASTLAVAVGAAMQIATSHFCTYNHGLILTGRVMF